MVHAQSYDYDSLKYKLLSFLHSKEDPIKEDSYESSGFELVESDYGVCSDCSRPNTSTDWCHMCNAERFRQGFGTWTSNNEYIDKFIQDAQLGAADRREVLEWIPYEKLKHVTYVARGGYSTIYKAIWIDGPISGWNHEMQQWQRYQFMYDDKCRFLTTLDNMYSGTFGISIALKCLHDSSNVDEEFLNEWKTHLKCYKVGNFSLIRLIGITQDPETSNYMVAMEYAANGSLGDDLKNLIQKNWYVRLRRLLEIITGLAVIHQQGLVHRDLHSGNILQLQEHYYNIRTLLISDLGLTQPVNKSKKGGEVYGVLPYVASEVLIGEPYTPAADIYSFGMIMWELTSGRQPFDNVPYDTKLCINIVRGTRPKTVEGTPESYAKLMMKCWDLNPLRRPTALELKETLGIWKKKCGYYYFDEEERKTWGDYDDDNDNYDDYEIRKATLEFIKADKDLERFQNFDKQIFTRHSKACYTSRLISFPGINILPNPQDYSASITALTLDDTIEESEKDHYTL